ncbi:anthocyanidin 3-O-glucosyltransferase 2-like [Salvia hispanica]|uniref:anthocyanidin 3-O-glucosyltransferase 2-like n=1 Tax=Salvia hispanica TaxID=49212 RepID=UPI002009249B|nr:anthocyanidin 3-O-glucosyltransferase 2-like [Salvia hispanica]
MMSADAKKTLVFIPFPIMSHLVSAVDFAKLLADRDNRLYITILIMKRTVDTKISSYTTKSPHPQINFLQLQENKSVASGSMGDKNWAFLFAESHKGLVRDVVAEMMESQKGKLAGFVLDMFCTPMIDVANELGAPAYIFFPSGSATLGLMFHLQSLRDDHGKNMKEYEDSDEKISIPTYVNSVPAKVWPIKVFDNETGFLECARRYRETRGIIVNTFLEFEHHAISSLSADARVPPVYPVGPMIQGGGEENEENKRKHEEIIAWLDKQPHSSVLFLCFGTRGSFEGDQVKEIATALEKSGVRFLWSLRKPPPEGTIEFPGEYENPEQALPEGFLRITTGIGKVIGWAPQMAVLSHPAVGGFVSHCGWNSTLESVWCGVPMAAWPLFAEQQVNAFQLVKDFEMAIEIKIDYRKKDGGEIVAAGTIERAIRQLMDPENKIRLKVKEVHDKTRAALVEGGSSYNFLGRLLEDIMDNAH